MVEFKEKLHRLEMFREKKNTKNKSFIRRLSNYYASIEKGYSWRLFFFLAMHHKTLFPIWKRNYLSKLNEFRKMARKVSKY